ncbi:interleukin-21 receptor [Nothobranchius furzeri]|uniref:Interleukin-21 receptor-like n=2 Tax=Nothobranchius furzeri TaxID=105023 RepID=A0A9D3BDU9_NOTFU|nr:interleukin-21 receptor [Nothobranchius furzeri]KAF7204579.1 interleukin-21 receptor-like [Nothobranchius furzeri]
MKELLWVVFLINFTGIVRLQGDVFSGFDHHLHCVNDYLLTLNCSLKIEPSRNASYWLTIKEKYTLDTYDCSLTITSDGYFCSIRVSEADDYSSEMFTDLSLYEISLCQSQGGGSDMCEVLDEAYEPVNNIKPNAPCCLTVSYNSSEYHFIWKSTYEEYSSSTQLPKYLQYQLFLYKTDEHAAVGTQINTDDTKISVKEENLVPDTKYAARVRSSPNMVHYMGQWSDWSSDVLWRTESISNGFPSFELCVGFAALSVMGAVILLLCYGPVKVWRQRTFIPTPAPYFHGLYKDYQGDFKSWVVTQENPDALKEEETLQIDTLIKFVAIPDDEYPAMFEHQVMEGREYSNVPTSTCDADLSTPDTGDSVGWLSAQGSSGKTPAWSETWSPADDSGCWLSSDTSLEKEPPWYCNEYCTLSCFQQSGCAAGGHQGALAQHRFST